MSADTKTITLRAKYEGDLRGLNDDIAKLKSIGRNLQTNNPFKIRPTLDLSGIRSDAQRAAKEFNTAFKSAMGKGVTPGSAVSQGGIIIPAGAISSYKQLGAVSKGVFKQVIDQNGKELKSFEQLAAGIQRVVSTTKKGKTTRITNDGIQGSFKAQLAQIEKEFSAKAGAAKANKGDLASVLEEKQRRLNDVLSGKQFGQVLQNRSSTKQQRDAARQALAELESIKNLPSFTRAEQSLSRLGERAAATRGNQDRAGAKANRGLEIDSLKDSLKTINESFAQKLGSAAGTKGDVASVLAQKRQAIENELRNFSGIADSNAFQGARNTLATLDKQIAQAIPSQDRAAAKRGEADLKKVRSSRETSLKDSLLGIDTRTAANLGNAKGSQGDVARVLADKRIRISDELAKFSDIADSPAFKAAQKSINALDKQIAQAVPSQNRAAAKRGEAELKKARSSRETSLKDSLLGIDTATSARIGATKGNQGDVARVLADKRIRISEELAKFSDIADSPAFKAAQKSINALDKQIQQAVPSQNRAAAKRGEAELKKVRSSRETSLKDSLLGIDTATSARIGATKGNKGDVAAILAEKRQLIQSELAKFSDIANSPAYKQAQKAINTLDKGIAQAVPTQQRSATKTTRATASQSATDFITRYDRRQGEKLVANKTEESNNSLIRDRATRESDLNRILRERESLLEKQANLYRQLEQRATRYGNVEASRKFRTAADRIDKDRNQAALDRNRGTNAATQVQSVAELNRRLQALIQTNQVQREILKNEEAAARKIPNRSARDSRLQAIQASRADLLNRTQAGVSGIAKEAGDRGLNTLQASAQAKLSGLQQTGVADLRRLTTATNQSGHATNFHTTSLLKNAATFTQWYIPAQLAMKSFAAFGAGAQGAIDAQRTFKILGATFRGTTEDAKLLADQTLMLAAANGRGVDEAAQAAVAWSRLGLTRNQILVATETSLRAANVAEISAAEATAYLTANYKAFGQTIAEIPATLDYINSLSNKSAVAPKEIFQGLSRSAAVAKSAGIEFETLASIIATVSEVTQRPGAESGNAVKTILSRLNKPSTTSDLKEQFGLDFSTLDGDVQGATQVLSKLAAVYPTLNTFEQARLKNIVAGANQGNRFAIIMEHWTETLIAQANAGLDANSAMRENANILDSVSSKIASLETSWTRLFHTVGEAGVFDFVSSALNSTSETINQMTSGVDLLVNSLDKLGQGAGLKEGTFGKFIKQQTKSFGANILDPKGFIGDFATDAVTGELTGPKKPAPTTSATTGKLGKLASESIESRNRVKALNAGDQAFQVIASQFGTKGVSNKTILEQFDKAVPVLSALPGGQANVAAARNNIRPLLESGDVEGGRRKLNQTAAELYVGKEKEFATAEIKRAESLKITEAAIAATTRESRKLNSELANSQPGEAQDKLIKKLYETDQALKEQQNSLTTLQQKFEAPIPDPLAAHKETLDAYLADLTAISAAYSQLLTSFGSSGFANLDSKLKLGSARLEGDLLEQTIGRSRTRNEQLDISDPDGKGKRDSALNTFRDRLSDIREATAPEERKIELERQTALLKTSYDDARTRTGSGFSRFETGRSEGEKLNNRTQGIFREINDDVNNPRLGAGNATQDAAELGSLTERLAQGKAGIAAMEDRRNRALAEQVNLEGDILEQSRKQTVELSKRLQLASREDQLRAAASAAFLRKSGQTQFTGEQFQFFSQEQRGAISNLAPKSVQGFDDNERDAAESRGKLNNEILGLGRDISAARLIFKDLQPKAENKAAGLYDPKNPFDSKGTTVGGLLDSNKDQIRLNLNTGPINIQLDFSKHVSGMLDVLQGKFDAATAATLESVKRLLSGNAEPNTSAAAGVR